MSPTKALRSPRLHFLGYAGVIALLTHWPQLRLAGPPIARPDLVVHLGVFSLWTILCVRARWFGAALSPRNIALAGVVSLVYVTIDETTQSIEFLRRSARGDDLAANFLGVAAGLVACLTYAAIEPDHAGA